MVNIWKSQRGSLDSFLDVNLGQILGNSSADEQTYQRNIGVKRVMGVESNDASSKWLAVRIQSSPRGLTYYATARY